MSGRASLAVVNSFEVQSSKPASLTRLALSTFALLIASSCSLVVEPDVDTLGSPPRTCTPHDEAICACLGGVQGVQVCNEGGSFDPCICGVAGSGG